MRKIGVFLLVAFVAFSFVAVIGCGDGEPSESPKEVADKYMKASIALDVDTAYSLLSEVDQSNMSKEQMRAEAQELEGLKFSYELGEERISGDEATVEVTLIIENEETGESERLDEALNLVKENGAWKIYLGDSL